MFFYQGIEGGETDRERGWECREKRGNDREEERGRVAEGFRIGKVFVWAC